MAASSPSTPALLEFCEVTHTFWRGGRAVHALSHVNLTLHAHESVAIVGKSGAGKSTLIHCALGLLTPTDGCVCIDGHAWQALTDAQCAQYRNQRVGYVPQDSLLIPTLTVWENLILMGSLSCAKSATLQSTLAERAHMLLERLALTPLQAQYPRHLSGGEMRRVAIARALMNAPTLIVADEPTSNLDQHSAQRVMQLLADLQQMGHTLLMVTHDRDTLQLVKHVYALEDGQLQRVTEYP